MRLQDLGEAADNGLAGYVAAPPAGHGVDVEDVPQSREVRVPQRSEVLIEFLGPRAAKASDDLAGVRLARVINVWQCRISAPSLTVSM